MPLREGALASKCQPLTERAQNMTQLQSQAFHTEIQTEEDIKKSISSSVDHWEKDNICLSCFIYNDQK